VTGFLIVLLHVLVFRCVATANKSADQAHAQGGPFIALCNAALADLKVCIVDADMPQVVAFLLFHTSVKQYLEDSFRYYYRIDVRSVHLFGRGNHVHLTQGADQFWDCDIVKIDRDSLSKGSD